MKRLSVFILGLFVLLLLLVLIALLAPPPSPIIAIPSGFYPEAFTVSIAARGPHETIHYTLDGSIPTIDSPVYTQPIEITDRAKEPNTISTIPTISYRYRPPIGSVSKITTLRARSFNNLSKAASEVVTQSYLVGKHLLDHYSLPIISLVADPKDFFDPVTGIYVTGHEEEVAASSEEDYFFWPANYHHRGQEWERPIYVEIFNTQGTLEYSQSAAVRIHGGASRSFRQKSLRLIAGNEHDPNRTFNYPLFPDLFDDSGENRIDSFHTFILRNAGTDFGATFMRDVLIQGLVDHTQIATQATRPVIVFLNGEYWGLYFLYEHYSEHYFLDHYGIQPENLFILDRDGDLFYGAPKDREHYQDMLDYINSHDVEDPLVYAEVSKLIDIENFIDYQITQIYAGHSDWPTTNIKYWRSRTTTTDPEYFGPDDGRWRWLLFDLDHGFSDFNYNGIEHAADENYPTTIFRSLAMNSEFQVLFLNRFADHLNTTFTTERVIQEINQIQATLEPEMQEQIDRWHSSGRSMEEWHANVEELRLFAHKRPEIMVRDLIQFFNLDGTFTLSSRFDHGYLRINGVETLLTTPGVQNPGSFSGIYFQNIPITITAIPDQGYQFSHWEGSTYPGETDPVIEITSAVDIQIDPVFVPVQ